mmetsp:Transcript_57213/g.165963  ORF Transcript_57213/g.165963 Transcript_57213/m.165963 type:complete len:1022 (-) Transcript_57213:394-3459(-)
MVAPSAGRRPSSGSSALGAAACLEPDAGQADHRHIQDGGRCLLPAITKVPSVRQDLCPLAPAEVSKSRRQPPSPSQRTATLLETCGTGSMHSDLEKPKSPARLRLPVAHAGGASTSTPTSLSSASSMARRLQRPCQPPVLRSVGASSLHLPCARPAVGLPKCASAGVFPDLLSMSSREIEPTARSSNSKGSSTWSSASWHSRTTLSSLRAAWLVGPLSEQHARADAAARHGRDGALPHLVGLAPPYFEESAPGTSGAIGGRRKTGRQALAASQSRADVGDHSDWAIQVLPPREWAASIRSPGGCQPPSDEDAHDQAAGEREQDPFGSLLGKIPWAPSSQEILRRHRDRAKGKGLSSEEQVRVLRAGRRYRLPDVSEVSRHSLLDVLIHLGYLGGTSNTIRSLVQGASSSNCLTFSELVEFIESYAELEKDELREVYDSCGCGVAKNGVTRTSLRNILHQLGAYPPDSAVNEAAQASGLAHVFGESASRDAGGSFEDLMTFLAWYRAEEGLSRQELEVVWRAWEAHASAAGLQGPKVGGRRAGERNINADAVASLELPLAKLEDLLFHMYGAHAKEDIVLLLQKVPSFPSKLDQAFQQPMASCQGITFHEVCIWFRRLRDVRRKRLWEDFELAETDDDGCCPFEELHDLLRGQGFTLSTAAIQEFLGEVGEDPNGPLDFDSYVRFLDRCQEHEGFTKQERAGLKTTFSRFDTVGSGELTLNMIFDLLRYMYGYVLREEEVQRIMREIDSDKSGTMCFREFLAMMRQYRESELKRTRAAWAMYSCSRQHGGLLFSNLPGALEAVKQVPRQEVIRRFQGSRRGSDTVTFDQFVEIADLCRDANVSQLRKQASFSTDEFASIRSRFEQQAGGPGEPLARGQVLWLLIAFGLPLDTLEARALVLEFLGQARASALEAGLDESEVGDGESQIKLYCFAHLVRLILRQREAEKHAKEEAAVVAARVLGVLRAPSRAPTPTRARRDGLQCRHARRRARRAVLRRRSGPPATRIGRPPALRRGRARVYHR